ncbi:hypothetical protein NB592_09775 [Vibrio parahaemolyticus]|uniref:hypothetical protein n=1 Tax=Vibrio parahaemolyticus TaxID=670 RepID=UPI00215C5578|nr:hypothetical protein [Vibrio parahaemolyticus]MCR9647990.1 hypothetical protein [Vibrio parahaemolyticus]MCR9799140.1 hypothetical protein [Vibrio parahaemolyticus]MDF4315410.1 hypothetical protein [Vibrio parahaemolyticus]HBH7907877.1 hypothetical protein [Vibrio parahaemolyticus]
MSALLKTYLEMAGPEICQSKDGFLAIIDAQTGLGKTYQATELQLAHLIADSKITLIYSTNLRVNVKEAYEALLERIDSKAALSEAQKVELKRNVIWIPAQDTAIAELSEEDWATIFEVLDVQQQRDVKTILAKVTLLNQAKSSSNTSVFDEDLRAQYGKIFTLLKAFLKGKECKCAALNGVLDQIFPARRIDQEKTQVLFLTTSKLLYPWHSIDKSYRISDFLDNSLLILDEFDRQQSEFLTHLINTVSDYDIIALTRKFYSSFDSFKIHGSPEFNGVDQCFDCFRNALADYKGKWHVNYRPFITAATIQKGSENQNRIFTLLSDRMSIHAINFKHEELKSQINHASGSHEIGPDGTESAIQFVNNGAQLVRTFCNGMLSAILKLKKNLEKRGDPRAYTTENLVEKILNNLGLVELTPSIMSLISARLSFKVQKEYRAYSFHDSGFEIANIAKYSDTDDTAKASTFDLALTSTGLLAHWVLAGARVLGVSATATSRTAIHNFDLEYLSDVLSDRLVLLSPEQKAAIQAEYCEKRRYAENQIHIDVKAISERVEWGAVAELYQEFRGMRLQPALLENELCKLLNVELGQLTFALNRANKLVESIRQFSLHPSNRYHFCMLNRSYRNREFMDFIGSVGQKYGVTIFENINAASFRNDQFQAILNLLETTTTKVAVITNYQATGAGLSPSYVIGEHHTLTYVGAEGVEPFQNKTDIDSIYLEQPMSLIGSRICEDLPLKERDLAIKKNIHDALMLHEKGIVVANAVKSKLKSLISTRVNGYAVGDLISTYKGSEDYRYAVYRFIEQALGRMCRTEWKQAEITIMYDAVADFVETLAKDSRNLSYLSHEYQALITEIKQRFKAIEHEKQRLFYHPRASRNYAHIQRLVTSVYEHQNENAIGQYERLRTWMLITPAMALSPTGEEVRYYIDVQAPLGEYQYQIDYSEDKGITEIFVNPADVSGLREVSETSARLPLLMQNPLVAVHFEAKGFATTFGGAQFVLAPAMFDLYMGALGEEAVSAILSAFGYQLKGMPEGCVEWFDGYIELGSRILLVDVKHWDLELGCLVHDNTLNKCQAKLEKIRADPPAEFANKRVQALYINTIWSGAEGINSRKYMSDSDQFVAYSNPDVADVIEVPGIIDSECGTNNVPTMTQLLEFLNQFAE